MYISVVSTVLPVKGELSDNSSRDRSSIRAGINKLKNQITKRLKQLKELRAEQLAESINNTDESRRMFEAVRETFEK